VVAHRTDAAGKNADHLPISGDLGGHHSYNWSYSVLSDTIHIASGGVVALDIMEAQWAQ